MRSRPEGQDTSFADVSEEAGRRIVQLRFAGVEADSSTLRWPIRRQFRVILYCSLPVIIFALQALLTPATPFILIALGWSVYFVVLSWIGLMLSFLAWRIVHRAAIEIDDLLGTESNRQTLEGWLRSGLSERRQLSFTVLGAAGFPVLLLIVASVPQASTVFYIGPASYISVAIAGLVLSSAVYWVVTGIRIISKVRGNLELQVLWPAPGRTPGIEALARLSRLAGLLGGIGTAFFAVPVLWIDIQLADHPLVNLAKWICFGLALSTTLVVAIAPQVELSRTVARARTNSIRAIEAQLPSLADFTSSYPGSMSDFSQTLTLLSQISASPSTTVNDRTIVAILIGIAASILPFVIQALAM